MPISFMTNRRYVRQQHGGRYTRHGLRTKDYFGIILLHLYIDTLVWVALNLEEAIEMNKE
jgi:hypothetical protein